MSGWVPNIRYSREPITVWNHIWSSGLTGTVLVEGLYSSGSSVWAGFALIILQCSSTFSRYLHWSIANWWPSWQIFIQRNSVVSPRSQHSHFFIKAALIFSTKAFEGPQNWASSTYIMARMISFPFCIGRGQHLSLVAQNLILPWIHLVLSTRLILPV